VLTAFPDRGGVRIERAFIALEQVPRTTPGAAMLTLAAAGPLQL
jgi:hypothetical protein